jgi:hypothetical protein
MRTFPILSIFLILYILSGCSSSGDCKSQNEIVENVIDQNISDENLSDDDTNTEINSTEPTEENITLILKKLYLAGVAIDGPISDANVTIGGKSVQTDKDGKWIVEFEVLEGSEKNITLGEVTTEGGTDTFTGEAFDGKLTAYVDSDDIIDNNETGDKSVVVTPLTGIVSQMVKSGLSEEEAEEKLAQFLGIPKEMLDKNPIEVLKTGSEEDKKHASKAIKKALVIQKFTETMTKSISKSSLSTKEKNQNFASIMGAIAENLLNSDTNSTSFDSVINDTDSIAKKSVENMMKKAEEENSTFENFEELEEKLKSAGEISKDTIMLINSIDETELSSGDSENIDSILEISAKGVEIANIKIKEKMIKIADSNISELKTLAAEAKKVTSAIVMLGGVKGLSTKVKEAMTKANLSISTDENSSTKTIDVSDFSSFINDDIMEEQSRMYDTFIEMNISQDMILKVAEKKIENEQILMLEGEEKPEFDLLATLKEVSLETFGDRPPPDFDKFADDLKNLEDDLKSFDERVSASITDVFDKSVIDRVDFSPKDDDKDDDFKDEIPPKDDENITLPPDDENKNEDNLTLLNPPKVSIISGATTGTNLTTFTFSAKSDIPNTIFSWFVDGVFAGSEISFSTTFSAGNHTISLIGTANGISSEKSSTSIYVTQYVVPVVDKDQFEIERNLSFGKFDGLIFEREIANGVFDEVLVENYNSRDFWEVSEEKAFSLLDFNFSLKNINFENESKKIQIIYRLDNIDNGTSAIYIISNLDLVLENGKFSINLLNSERDIRTISKDGEEKIITSDLNISKILQLENSNLKLSISESELRKEFQLIDGNYEIKVVLSGDFDDILNGLKYDSNIFSNFSTSKNLSKSSYGFEGELKIEKSETSGISAPPSTPSIPQI